MSNFLIYYLQLATWVASTEDPSFTMLTRPPNSWSGSTFWLKTCFLGLFFCFFLSLPCVNVSDKAVVTKHWLVSLTASEENQSSERHIGLLPDVENHYDDDKVWGNIARTRFKLGFHAEIKSALYKSRLWYWFTVFFFRLFINLEWDQYSTRNF